MYCIQGHIEYNLLEYLTCIGYCASFRSIVELKCDKDPFHLSPVFDIKLIRGSTSSDIIPLEY